MRYTNILAVLFASAVSQGCDNSSTEEKTTTGTNTTSVPTPATIDTNATAQVQSHPVSVPAPVINITAPANAATVSTTGLNPAHGQPGHRCDIAVGAPLDSKPIQSTANTTQPIVTQTTAPALTPNTSTPVAKIAMGINPAHGQPGHRCDIAVGAPLNSKPTANITQPVVTQTTTPAITPNTPTPVAKVAPGMNPAHGQPGHRCDIAVGAPLNTKPAQ